MPGPASVLRTHDALVVIGSHEGIDRLERTWDLESGIEPAG
jgi:K+/H+ antiporter YhaU regulatory subunit KhtT